MSGSAGARHVRPVLEIVEDGSREDDTRSASRRSRSNSATGNAAVMGPPSAPPNAPAAAPIRQGAKIAADQLVRGACTLCQATLTGRIMTNVGEGYSCHSCSVALSERGVARYSCPRQLCAGRTPRGGISFCHDCVAQASSAGVPHQPANQRRDEFFCNNFCKFATILVFM